MKNNVISLQNANCPLPLTHKDMIVMGHGSGGKMTHDLVSEVFLRASKDSGPLPGNDGAVLPLGKFQVDSQQMVVSTDSHVVAPLFFPGGDIGRLAICGTVNDITMMGAQPLYITTGFIIEEGLEIALLNKIVTSMLLAAEEANIQIVAGDTKVVQKGKADGLYINTTGVGFRPITVDIDGSKAQPGDKIILSGSIGDHGIAVLSARGELGFEAEIQSDVAPLNHLVAQILETSDKIHVLRDPTRGGLATTLNEITQQSSIRVTIEESAIPVHPAVRSACEMLGFDPMYVANEGKFVAFVGASEAERVLAVIKAHPLGREAAIIGVVEEKASARVHLRTTIGTHRLIGMLSGEMLPRIC